MRKLLLLFFLLVFALAEGREITESEAAVIASEFFNMSGQNPQRKGSPRAVKPDSKKSAETVGEARPYYIFNADDSCGFVIVSGDDEMKPVVGYSVSGSVAGTTLPPQLEAYLAGYEKQLALMRSGDARRAATAGGQAVAPLITSKWGQGEPYNMLCPMTGSMQGAHWVEFQSLTGCVATAMAQVMNYHEFPPKGHGTFSHPSNELNTIDLSKSTYDWVNMKDSYSGSYTDAEADAVARLMFDAGLSVNTSYKGSGSGAYPGDIAPALLRNFNYSKDARFLLREAFTSQEWVDMIRENLLAKRPIIYGAEDHEFVCDGIDSNDYLHISWGWYGSYDGYFDMNALEPYGAGGVNYYRDQDMIAYIHPGDPDADNTSYTAPLSVFNLRVCRSYTMREMPYEIFEAEFDDNGRLLEDTPSFAIAFKLYNSTNNNLSVLPWVSNVNTPINIHVALYDKNKKWIQNFPGTEIGNAGYRTVGQFRTGCSFEKIADGTYYVSLARDKEVGKDGQGNPVYEPDELLIMNEKFIKVVKSGNNLYFEKYTSSTYPALPVEVVSAEVDPKIDFHTDCRATFKFRNLSERLIDKDDNSVRIYYKIVPVAEETEYLDTESFKTYEASGSFDVPYVYPGETVEAVTRLETSKLTPGQYRVYFTSNGRNGYVELDRGKKHRFEITPLPDDGRPLVITEPVITNSGTHFNLDHQGVDLSFRYLNVSTRNYYYTKIWCAPADNPADKYILFERTDAAQYYAFNKEQVQNLKGNDGYVPDVSFLWKKPGQYRLWVSISSDLQNWIDYDEPENCGTITIQEYQHPEFPLIMSAPARLSSGNTVKPGSKFDVEFRFKASRKVSLDPNELYLVVSESPEAETNYGWQDGWTADKTELNAGDEVVLRSTVHLNRDAEIDGKALMVLPFFVRDSRRYYLNPADYKESISITVNEHSDAPLVISALPEFTRGNVIYPGDYFDITLKIKALKPFTINTDMLIEQLQTTSDEGITYTFRHAVKASADKTVLKAGEETELHVTALSTDDKNFTFNLVNIMFEMYNSESRSWFTLDPGKYEDRLFFHPTYNADYCPVVLTEPMKFEKEAFENYFDRTLHNVTFKWRSLRPSLSEVMVWYYAAPVSCIADKFWFHIMRTSEKISTEETEVTVPLESGMLWLSPGDYNVLLEYNFYNPDGSFRAFYDNISGTFSVSDNVSPDLPLELSAPAEFSPETITTKTEFEVVLKAKALSNCTLNPDMFHYLAKIDKLYGAAYTLRGGIKSISVDKTNLKAGDEVTIRMKAVALNHDECRDKDIVFIPVNYDSKGQTVALNPGKYLDSLWLHVSADTAVDTVTADADFSYTLEGDLLTVSGLRDGDKAELYNAAGMTVAATEAIGNKGTLSIAGIPSGVYLLRISSATFAPRTAKLFLR